MANEDLNFRLRVQGQAESSQRINRFTQDVRGLDKAAVGVGGKFSALAGSIGNLGTAVAGASPAFGQFAGVIGTAGSAISGLTSVIGGVGGIVGATLIGSLGVMAVQMIQAKKRTDELSKSMRGATRSLQDFVAAAQKAQSARALASRIATGTATDLEFAGAIRKANAPLIRARLREKELLDKARGGGAIDTQELVNIRREIASRRAAVDQLRANRERARREAAQAPDLDREEADVERQAAAARAGAPTTEDFRVQGQARTGAAAELQALGFIGADAGAPSADASVFGSGGADAGFFGDLQQTGFNVGRKQKFDVRFTDRAKAAIQAEKEIQAAVRETAQARQAADQLAVQGASQALATVLIGNDKRFEAEKRQAQLAVQMAKTDEERIMAQRELDIINQQSSKNRAKAALAATGDALVGQGVQHLFQAAAMAFIPGAQGNAAALAGVGAAEIAAGKAMGALFAASAPTAAPARPSAQGTRDDQGLFVQVNVNPLTGEQIVKTMRGERRKRGANAVAF